MKPVEYRIAKKCYDFHHCIVYTKVDIFTRKRCLAGLGRLNVGQNVEKLGHSLISDRFSLIRYSVIDSVSAVSEKKGGNF